MASEHPLGRNCQGYGTPWHYKNHSYSDRTQTSILEIPREIRCGKCPRTVDHKVCHRTPTATKTRRQRYYDGWDDEIVRLPEWGFRK